MSRKRKHLPFDQLVEERRAKRFDERSPAREREAFERISEKTGRLSTDMGNFLSTFQHQRAESNADDLIESWTRGVDMIEDAADLMLERFYEAAVVTACTAVEVMLGGLIRHHIRVNHFTRNKGLGEEIVSQLLRNGFRDRVPALVREAWGLDLRPRAEWKTWMEIYRSRNDIVHRALESSLEEALDAVKCAAGLIEFLSEIIESKAESDRSASHVWAMLHATTSQTMRDLKAAFAAIDDHVEMMSPENL